MTFSVREVFNWVVTTVGTDSQMNSFGITKSRIFASQAPEGTAYPYIIIQRQASGHDYTMGMEAVQRHYLLIKVVYNDIDGGDLGRRIMERVNFLINDKVPVFTLSRLLSFRSKTDVDYVEVHPGNLTFYNVGILYEAYLGEN